jgi:hypothetical protein
MQQTCTHCGSIVHADSRFCTNCGTVLGSPTGYRQSWEAPPASNAAQVPPWAQTPGGGTYQQQQMGMSGANSGGSPGIGGSSDAWAKNLLKIAGFVILGALLLLIVCIALAIVIPVPGIRWFFVIVALLLILIPWIIYSRIRAMIRRTMGDFWRFF